MHQAAKFLYIEINAVEQTLFHTVKQQFYVRKQPT